VSIPEISVHEAQARLSAPNPPRLIDVREAAEWELCRLPGAELLPLSEFAALAPARLTDPEEAMIIYCHHGGRSGRVTEFLVQQGFSGVQNLAGGIDAWSAEVDPSVARY
jgi:rhodanese-related sulfurtransferase